MEAEVKEESRAMQVPCIRCDAKPNEHCVQPGRKEPLVGGFHSERVELSRKVVVAMPKGEDLDATDKALITYFAYILLCDSVSAKSVELFGKQFASEEIQRWFGQQAVTQLRAEGLLK